MAGLEIGLIALTAIQWTHCVLHRESLAAKEMSAEFANTVVKSVHFIKKGALQTHLFTSLCEASGEEHRALLYHSEVWWLSHGSVLVRVFELRKAIHKILVGQNRTELAVNFNDNVWVTKLAYMADVFSVLNKLNSSMQGRNTHAIQLYDRMEGFLKKTKRLREWVSGANCSMFPSVGWFCGTLPWHDTRNCWTLGGTRPSIWNVFRSKLNIFSEAKPDEGTRRRYNFRSNTNLTASEEDQLLDLSTDSTCIRMCMSQGLSSISGYLARQTSPSWQQRQCWVFCLLQPCILVKVDFPPLPTWKVNTVQDCSLRLI